MPAGFLREHKAKLAVQTGREESPLQLWGSKGQMYRKKPGSSGKRRVL